MSKINIINSAMFVTTSLGLSKVRLPNWIQTPGCFAFNCPGTR